MSLPRAAMPAVVGIGAMLVLVAVGASGAWACKGTRGTSSVAVAISEEVPPKDDASPARRRAVFHDQPGVQPVDGRVAWMNLGLHFFRTSDGGEHWIDRTPIAQGYGGLSMLDPDCALYLAVDGIRHTTDGGLHWMSISGGRYGASFSFDARRSWIVATAGDGKSTEILRTTDGGATWVSSALSLPVPRGAGRVWITSPDGTNVFVAYELHLPPAADLITRLFVSTDGGATWAQRHERPRLEAIAFLDALHGFAILAKGTRGPRRSRAPAACLHHA